MRIAFLVVATIAWLPALGLAATMDDSRVWLALGLGALAGGCAAIAWLAHPVPQAAAEPAPPVAVAAVPEPAATAEPPAPPPPPAEPAVPPEVAAWVAAAQEAMRPRVRAEVPARGEEPAREASGQLADAAAVRAGTLGSVDARLSKLAARQRAHTSDLRRSIRSALERQERAEPA